MHLYVESTKPVWKNPYHVFVNEQAIEQTAQKLALRELNLLSWRSPVYPVKDDERFVEFLGVSNAINFCFTDFKTRKKFDVEYPKGSGQIWYGSFGMSACLMRALDDGIPILDPDFLANDLSEEIAANIFEHVTTPIPLFKYRVRNLKNVGHVLQTSGIKSFTQLFKDADFRFFADGRGITETLVSLFECYAGDFSLWKGYVLQFHKRAQLLPMLYHGRACASKGALIPLKDPENIGPIADYQIPHALRVLGILSYTPELTNMVDNGEEVLKDSNMEIEIRAQTVQAMWKLVKRINEICSPKKKIGIAELDPFVWYKGRKDKTNHHYTYTTAY